MYTMNICLVVLVILLFFIYVYVDEHKITLFEGLQNEEDGDDVSGLPWKKMYSYLTTYEDNDTPYNVLINSDNKPFSSSDFAANLIESDVESDFKYFNNATAIYTGYEYKKS